MTSGVIVAVVTSSGFADAASRILTVIVAFGVAWITARASTRSTKLTTATQEKIEDRRTRAQAEDDAYTRAEGYWKSALNDARRELDAERRERREEVAELRARVQTLEVSNRRSEARAQRAEAAVRALARRTGEPDPLP